MPQTPKGFVQDNGHMVKVASPPKTKGLRMVQLSGCQDRSEKPENPKIEGYVCVYIYIYIYV